MSTGSDSVGTLLAAIANLVVEGLRILSLSDKRQWGQDEYEQVRALEEVLDEAKKDFQDLSPLVNGQVYYENDRKRKWNLCAWAMCLRRRSSTGLPEASRSFVRGSAGSVSFISPVMLSFMKGK